MCDICWHLSCHDMLILRYLLRVWWWSIKKHHFYLAQFICPKSDYVMLCKCNIVQLASYIQDSSPSYLHPSCCFYSVPFVLHASTWFTVFTVIAVITINSVMTHLSVMILAPINFGLEALIIFWLSFWYFLDLTIRLIVLTRHLIILISIYLLITYDYYLWPLPIKWV